MSPSHLSQGVQTTVVVDEGQVNRFKKRFAGLEALSSVQTVSQKNAEGKKK